MFFARNQRRSGAPIAGTHQRLGDREGGSLRAQPRTAGNSRCAGDASLAAGVLTINGTTGNDSIVLRQANGRVSIGGITATFASANVSSVVVNAGTGNDVVSLVGLKGQPWTKPVTVNSPGGTTRSSCSMAATPMSAERATRGDVRDRRSHRQRPGARLVRHAHSRRRAAAAPADRRRRRGDQPQ